MHFRIVGEVQLPQSVLRRNHTPPGRLIKPVLRFHIVWNQNRAFPVELADEILRVRVTAFQTWWELQCQIEDFYSERERQRPPLSQQKEFRSIKNAVIQEAENIRMGKVTFEDEEMEEAKTSARRYGAAPV